jgi:hypothetical protein
VVPEALAVPEVLAVLEALARAAATTPCEEPETEIRRASRQVVATQAASPWDNTKALAAHAPALAGAVHRWAVEVAAGQAAEARTWVVVVVVVVRVAAAVVDAAAVAGVVDRRHP